MKYLIFLALFIPAALFAKDLKESKDAAETKVPVKEGYGTLNMDEFKDMNRPTSGKSGMTFTQTCKGKSGVEYKAGDHGYEACLREAQLDNTIGNKNGASPGVGVQFGN